MVGERTSYPVYSLDKRLLLPAGTAFTADSFRTLICSGSSEDRKKYCLLEAGSIREDIRGFLCTSPPNPLLSDERELAEVIRLMEQVELAGPMIDSVEYFKEYDPYTYRHILTVFAYSTLLSKDLVQNYRAMIRDVSTSPLHDFGKICVPLGILNKGSPLTREERNQLEHHTVAGYILLSYYSQSVGQIAARVARDHHERRTGSGYPRGIHLTDPMVEIVAVCDIYDALTSRRPYRPISYDNRSALEEITLLAEKGEVSWEVVQALVAHHRKGKPRFTECSVSLDKRGVTPPGNLYGIIKG